MRRTGDRSVAATGVVDNSAYATSRRKALGADVAARGDAEGAGQAGGFVDVAAEKRRRLVEFDPFAEGGAAGVFAGGEFVELGIEWREVDDEI